eukprot:6510865-Lingulodinium_polyedra.AAC.1
MGLRIFVYGHRTGVVWVFAPTGGVLRRLQPACPALSAGVARTPARPRKRPRATRGTADNCC